jgi:hypothetical protein
MAAKKVGRNDPCPCNSGRKYKKCHGDPAKVSTSPTPRPPGPQFAVKELELSEVPADVLQIAAKQRQADLDYIRQFGYARAPVSAEHQGHRFVAVGGDLIFQPAEKAKYFPDFLLVLMSNIFGREWWDAEVAKPRDQRHPAFQWRSKAITFQNKQRSSADGTYCAQYTGPMLAYYSFAYDLFVVKDNGRLDARLIERLKRQDLFQGARHELFAEATCIRAGFSIEHENEADGSTRHAEFAATHRETGERVSVEAKSKHRPGVIGQPGERESVGSQYLPITKLLRDAITKNPPHPLVVFLDMNLPREIGERVLSMNPPHPLITRTLDKLHVGDAKLDPISLLVVTNHPEVYTADEDEATPRQLLSLIPVRPLKPMANPIALQAIHEAANKSVNIPQHFPQRQ